MSELDELEMSEPDELKLIQDTCMKVWTIFIAWSVLAVVWMAQN